MAETGTATRLAMPYGRGQYITSTQREMELVPDSLAMKAQAAITRHYGTFYGADREIKEMLANSSLAEFEHVQKHGIYIFDSKGNRINSGLRPWDHHSDDAKPAVFRARHKGTNEENVGGPMTFGIHLNYQAKGQELNLLIELSRYAQKANAIIQQKREEEMAVRKESMRGSLLSLEQGLQFGKYSFWPVSRAEFHSLWDVRGESVTPVFNYNGGTSIVLYSTAQRKFIEPREISTAEISDGRLESMVREGLKEGDFFTGAGHVLIDMDAKIADTIFGIARNHKMLPPADNESIKHHLGQLSRFRRKRQKMGPAERFWGLEHFHELGPDKLEEGGLFGDGSHYTFFYFMNKGADGKGVVFMESDKERYATYVFRLDAFEALKLFDRKTLRDLRPDGFLGKFDHRKEGQDYWKGKVLEYLVPGTEGPKRRRKKAAEAQMQSTE